jgi:hypothetical protein
MRITKSDLRRMILEAADSITAASPSAHTKPDAIPPTPQKSPDLSRLSRILAHAVVEGVKSGDMEQLKNAVPIAQQILQKGTVAEEELVSLEEIFGLGKKAPEQASYDAVYRQWEVAAEKARRTGSREWEQRANQLRQKLYSLDAASPKVVKRE